MILFYFFFIIIILILIYLSFNYFSKQTIYIEGEKYKVYRFKKDKIKVAKVFNDLDNRVLKFLKYLKNNKNNYVAESSIHKLLNNYDPGSLVEGNSTYTINKGKKISICARDQNKQIYDNEILMFVLLHEMSHIAIKEREHPPIFGKHLKKF